MLGVLPSEVGETLSGEGSHPVPIQAKSQLELSHELQLAQYARRACRLLAVHWVMELRPTPSLSAEK